MIEKEIQLEGIDPRDFYGINNAHIELITELFPKLKIIARGSNLKVLGTASEIKKFEQRLKTLTNYFRRYGHLSVEVIEQLMSDHPSDRVMREKLPEDDDIIVFGNRGNIIRARTVNQLKLMEAYETKDLVFAIGPAGSGKTYTAIALAVRALKNREVRRIILTRPAVEAGEKLGFLPGDMKEKLDPYLQPLYDALNDMFPISQLERYLDEGTVQIAPLAYMRGRTLDNAFVILDEAQNTTLPQMKMFLTRMGRNAKFIVTGDITQVDLPRASDSGLVRSINILSKIDGIGLVQFDNRDILRHPIVRDIVDAFEEVSKNKGSQQIIDHSADNEDEE